MRCQNTGARQSRWSHSFGNEAWHTKKNLGLVAKTFQYLRQEKTSSCLPSLLGKPHIARVWIFFWIWLIQNHLPRRWGFTYVRPISLHCGAQNVMPRSPHLIVTTIRKLWTSVFGYTVHTLKPYLTPQFIIPVINIALDSLMTFLHSANSVACHFIQVLTFVLCLLTRGEAIMFILSCRCFWIFFMQCSLFLFWNFIIIPLIVIIALIINLQEKQFCIQFKCLNTKAKRVAVVPADSPWRAGSKSIPMSSEKYTEVGGPDFNQSYLQTYPSAIPRRRTKEMA